MTSLHGGAAIPTVQNVPVATVGVRPDLFQARDTSGGEAHSDDRVKEIVANWNPERFDPIAVVANPDRPGEYIVISGHHRLEAVKRLDLPAVPVRVLSGDIRDVGERQRLEREAVVSNFGVAESNLRERVTAVGRLADSGLSKREVATQMRIKPSEADRLLWLRRLPPGIIERAMIQPELTPAAAELGRAMERHGLGEEAVGGLFTRWAHDYDETGKVPGQYVLRQQLETLARPDKDNQASQEGFGGLAGFGGEATLGAFDAERKRAEDLETRIRGTRQRLTSCQSLAAELGVSIEDVNKVTGRRLTELTEAQEKAVRDTIALHREQAAGEPTNPAAPGPPELHQGSKEALSEPSHYATTASEQPALAKTGPQSGGPATDETTTTPEGTGSTRGGLTSRLKSLIAANRAAGAQAAGAAARSAARAGQGVQRARTRSADALDKLAGGIREFEREFEAGRQQSQTEQLEAAKAAAKKRKQDAERTMPASAADLFSSIAARLEGGNQEQTKEQPQARKADQPAAKAAPSLSARLGQRLGQLIPAPTSTGGGGARKRKRMGGASKRSTQDQKHRNKKERNIVVTFRYEDQEKAKPKAPRPRRQVRDDLFGF